MAAMSPTKGYLFNALRPDRVLDGYPWLLGLAVRPRVWAVNLKMVEEAVTLNQQAHHGVPNDMTAIMKMCWAVKEECCLCQLKTGY